jgi:hypothetical protein
MDNVTPINTTNKRLPDLDQLMVETLEELLERAKAGKLEHMLFVAQDKDGQRMAEWIGRPRRGVMDDIEKLKFAFHIQEYTATGEQ